MTKPTGGDLIKGFDYSPALVGSVLGAIVLFTCSFGLTYSHIVWYQSEFLALEIRAAGSAISTASCWIANLVVSVTYLSELETLTATGTYGLYFGFILIGYIFVYFCYPETSEFRTPRPQTKLTIQEGLSIDETQGIFSDGYGVKKAQAMLQAKRDLAERITRGEQPSAGLETPVDTDDKMGEYVHSPADTLRSAGPRTVELV